MPIYLAKPSIYDIYNHGVGKVIISTQGKINTLLCSHPNWTLIGFFKCACSAVHTANENPKVRF